jgi:hypothetical protein
MGGRLGDLHVINNKREIYERVARTGLRDEELARL